jgi:hypothetical protein
MGICILILKNFLKSCLLCDVQFPEAKNGIPFGKHLKFCHKEWSSKRYYDEFLRVQGEGVCSCGKETSFRGPTAGYLTFCSRSCKSRDPEISANREMTLEKRFGRNPYSKLASMRKEKLRKEKGVDNVFQLDEVKKKSHETWQENYGTEFPSQNDDVKKRIIANRMNTMFERYGVGHALQHGPFFEKFLRHSYNRKIMNVDGREFVLQGWEDLFLRDVSLFGIRIDEVSNDVPRVRWEDAMGKTRYYFPDFFVEPRNLVVEVKSTWTYDGNKKRDKLRISVERKLESARKIGLDTLLLVYRDRKNKPFAFFNGEEIDVPVLLFE